MEFKEIRKKTGLSQQKFSDRYGIPLDTIKSWESNISSTRYRKCPDYVLKLIHDKVLSDVSNETSKEREA